MQHLLIEYADPGNQLDSITLRYKLRSNPVVLKWAERVKLAQLKYPIDNPDRFYGFGPIEHQRALALEHINACITIINQEQDLVWRRPESVFDQDCLNYLHHIFEVYHGLLDQNPESNPRLKSALARLNVLVHQCESVSRESNPRHVVTYYGLPKTEILDANDYSYSVDTWEPGTVFLNYVEIGKTLENLATDNDQYIANSAFQPFRHYSADFVVRFSARTSRQAEERHAKIYSYYQAHQDKFGPWQDCYEKDQFALADLDGELDIEAISTRQLVKTVQLT